MNLIPMVRWQRSRKSANRRIADKICKIYDKRLLLHDQDNLATMRALMTKSLDGPIDPLASLTSRQREIVGIVRTHGYATLDDLARRFGVSTQSVRRDVIRLDELQLLQRFHGGAGPADGTVRLSYGEKQSVAAEGKARIGQATANLIPNGSSVFLDVGTTVEAVARALADKRQLRIFTTSLPCALAFAGREEIEVFVIGGILRGVDGSLVGDLALEAVRRFRFDIAVIGCSGFDDDGSVMDFDLHKITIKRVAAELSRRAILVADSSKFNRSAVVRVAGLSDFSTLVTDGSIPAELEKLAGTEGVEILMAT